MSEAGSADFSSHRELIRTDNIFYGKQQHQESLADIEYNAGDKGDVEDLEDFVSQSFGYQDDVAKDNQKNMNALVIIEEEVMEQEQKEFYQPKK